MDTIYTKNSTIEIAKKAGEISKKYFNTPGLISTSKSDIDFMTQADQEVDEYIRTAIKEHFPNAQLLTEETAQDDLSFFKEAENLWVIDPIDGTTNFSRSDEHYSISIALVNHGITSLGVVYLPLEDRLYFADFSEEYASCNDKTIKVSSISDLKKASIGFDWSWNLEKRKEMMRAIQKFFLEIRQPRTLGSAAADICMVADGRLDGYLGYGVKPWDIAAGILIAQKSGAYVSSTNIFDEDIFIANPAVADQIKRLLTE